MGLGSRLPRHTFEKTVRSACAWADLPQLPIEIWTRIADCLTTKEWIRSSAAWRSWASLQPLTIDVEWKSDERAVPWLCKHWSGAKWVRLSPGTLSVLPLERSERQCYPALRVLWLVQVDDCLSQWAKGVLACTAGVETLVAQIRGPTPMGMLRETALASLKHIVIDMRYWQRDQAGKRCIEPSDCCALEELRNLETLHMYIFIPFRGEVVATVPPLDLSRTRICAIAFDNVIPEELKLLPSTTLFFEGSEHAMIQAWQAVGHLITASRINMHHNWFVPDYSFWDTNIPLSLGQAQLRSLEVEHGREGWTRSMPALRTGDQFVQLSKLIIDSRAPMTLDLADFIHLQVLAVDAEELCLKLPAKRPTDG